MDGATACKLRADVGQNASNAVAMVIACFEFEMPPARARLLVMRPFVCSPPKPLP
jgi:hypothetical protein